MALNQAEKAEFDRLKARAQVADELEQKNEELSAEAGEAAAALAQAEIDKKEAIAAAVAEREAELKAELAVAHGVAKKNPIVDPRNAPKFNPDAYSGEVFGKAKFAQNGWFYDGQYRPIRPINPESTAPEEKLTA